MRQNNQDSLPAYLTIFIMVFIGARLVFYKVPLLDTKAKCDEVLRQLITLSGLMLTLFYAIVVPKLSLDKGDIQNELQQYSTICRKLMEQLLAIAYIGRLIQQWHFTTQVQRNALTTHLDSIVKVSLHEELNPQDDWASRLYYKAFHEKKDSYLQDIWVKEMYQDFSKEEQRLVHFAFQCLCIESLIKPAYKHTDLQDFEFRIADHYQKQVPFNTAHIRRLHHILSSFKWNIRLSMQLEDLLPGIVESHANEEPYIRFHQDSLEFHCRINLEILDEEYMEYGQTQTLAKFLHSRLVEGNLIDYFRQLIPVAAKETINAYTLLIKLLSGFKKARYNIFFWASYLVLLAGLLAPMLCLAYTLPDNLHRQITLASAIITLCTISFTFIKSFAVFTSNELDHLR